MFIIRKRPAVEALGSATVLCTDKTGTLTPNQMTVRTAWCARAEYTFTGGGYDPVGEALAAGSRARAEEHPALLELVTCGAVCIEATLVARDGQWEMHGDPTEAALVVSARRLAGVDLSRDALPERFPRVAVIPFESDRQFMATLHSTAPGSGRGRGGP